MIVDRWKIMKVSWLAVGLAALLSALAAVVMAGSALATQPIDSFESTISTTKVGGHPDIVTKFALDSPGAPEVARNITFSTPEGIFGNPLAINRCTSLDFALEQCQSASQS